MYLHTDDDKVVLLKNIIGIFDYNTLKNNKENKKSIGNVNKKTVIILEEKKKSEIVESDLSVSTFKKRIEKSNFYC